MRNPHAYHITHILINLQIQISSHHFFQFFLLIQSPDFFLMDMLSIKYMFLIHENLLPLLLKKQYNHYLDISCLFLVLVALPFHDILLLLHLIHQIKINIYLTSNYIQTALDSVLHQNFLCNNELN